MNSTSQSRQHNLNSRLEHAIIQKNIGVVRELIREGADVDHKSTTSPNELTMLHVALQSNQPDALIALIQAGADVNQVNTGNETPLHWAALFGSVPMATILLDAGADITKVAKGGKTVMHFAIAQIQGLKRSDMVPFLVSRGANPNVLREDGRSPLHCAAAKDCPLSCMALLQAGADFSILTECNNPETALQMAQRTSQHSAEEALITWRQVNEANRAIERVEKMFRSLSPA
jgi:ankyrin repeat protein